MSEAGKQRESYVAVAVVGVACVLCVFGAWAMGLDGPTIAIVAFSAATITFFSWISQLIRKPTSMDARHANDAPEAEDSDRIVVRVGPEEATKG